MDFIRALAAAATLVVAAGSAFAHGGGMVIPRNRDRGRATGDVPPSPPPPPPPGPAVTGGERDAPTTISEADPATKDHWFSWWTTQRRAFQRTRMSGAAPTTPGERDAATRAAADPVAAALLRGASDADDDVATGCLVALGRTGDAGQAQFLAGVVTDPLRRDTQREAAACGLAFLGAARAGAARPADALAQTVADPKATLRLRAIAAYALGLRGEPESRDILLAAILSPATPPSVAAASAAAVGLIGGDESEAVLVDLLARGRQDADPGLLRAHAAQGLARCGGPRAVEALVKATEDKDADVRRAALFALGAVAGPADEAALRAFRKRVDQDPDMGCRDAAILGMGRQGAPLARKTIDDAVAGGRSVHRSFALTALGFWARRNDDAAAALPLRAALAADRTPSERAAACFALGLAADRGAGPVVVRIAEGGAEGNVRAVAASVVADLADPAEAVLVLRRLLVTSEPSEVRREAAIALGTIGDAAAAKDLLAIVESGEGMFERAAAVAALGRIGGAGVAAELASILSAGDRPPFLRALAAVGLGLLREQSAARPLWLVAADLELSFTGDAVAEMLTIL